MSGRFRRLVRGLALDVTPLRNRAYRHLWLGMVITIIGTQMTMVAVPTQVYLLTGSTVDVGITSLIALVPLVIFGLLGGALADSLDKRLLILITSAGTAVTSILLWLQALLPGGGSIWLLWTLAAVQSGFFAVNVPARTSSIPRLLPIAQIPSASALSMTVQSGGVIAGPLLAGLVIQHGGLAWTYLIDAVGLTLALLFLIRLPAMPPQAKETVDRATSMIRTALRNVWLGFRFLRGQPILYMTFVVDIIAMVFGWPRALFPELAEVNFGDGTSLGWLFAAPSIGALLAGLVSGWITRVQRQGFAVLVAISLWGAAIVMFGLSSSLHMAVFWLAVAGAADMVSSAFRNSMLQTAAPDEMRGRLQGVFIVVVAGGPRLGDLRVGAMSATFSPVVTLVSGGIVIVVAMLVLAFLVPSFRRYRVGEGNETEN